MLRKAKRGCRARSLQRQAGRDLNAAPEVERQHAELMPRTVGGVLQRPDAGEGQTGLQLAARLLVTAPVHNEVPQVAATQRLVRPSGCSLADAKAGRVGLRRGQNEKIFVRFLLTVEVTHDRPRPGSSKHVARRVPFRPGSGRNGRRIVSDPPWLCSRREP